MKSCQACILLITLLLGVTSVVESAGVEKSVVESSMDSGAPPKAGHYLGGSWYYGLRFAAEIDSRSDYDLDAASADKLTVVTPFNPSLAFAWRDSDDLLAYTVFELNKPYAVTDEVGEYNQDFELQLDKAFLSYHHKPWSFTVGRQRFKTPREWMFDDTVDGVKARFSGAGYALTGAFFRERAFTEDLLQTDRNKRVDHFWFQLALPDRDDREINAFILRQTDHDRDAQTDWVGAIVEGEWGELDYWAQMAMSRTRDSGVQSGGIGYDAGVVYRVLKQPRIYMFGSIAFGQGDPDDVDQGFRQTDLQDNAAKLGGVTRVRYYGEVFDPELSNLLVVTAGVGMRPSRDSSLTLLWHNYRQHYPLDEFRETDLNRDPEGVSTDLGSELDLVLGYRIKGKLRLEAVWGVFLPGDAFDRRDPAARININVRYSH